MELILGAEIEKSSAGAVGEEIPLPASLPPSQLTMTLFLCESPQLDFLVLQGLVVACVEGSRSGASAETNRDYACNGGRFVSDSPA